MKFVMLFLSVVSTSTALAMPPCDDCENLDAKGVYEKILALSNTPNLPPLTVKDLQKNPVEGVATCVYRYEDEYRLYFMPTRFATFTKKAGPFSSLTATTGGLMHGRGIYCPECVENYFWDTYDAAWDAYEEYTESRKFPLRTQDVSCIEKSDGSIEISIKELVNDRPGKEVFWIRRAPSDGSVIFNRHAENNSGSYAGSLCIL